tara:strand:- start:335 stop:493 length:159 start_codon:yes stop_codon:yes gene_type:complete
MKNLSNFKVLYLINLNMRNKLNWNKINIYDWVSFTGTIRLEIVLGLSFYKLF